MEGILLWILFRYVQPQIQKQILQDQQVSIAQPQRTQDSTTTVNYQNQQQYSIRK